jgi:nitrogen regulation protein NR(I)
MPMLLAIDDEPLILDCLRYALAGDQLSVATARTAAEGLSLFRERRPDAVIADVRLPDMSGLDLFQELHSLDPKVPVILITGHGTSATAIEAMRRGAFEYLTKPLDPDGLGEVVGRALAVSRMMRVPAVVAADAGDNTDVMLGGSPAMQEVYKAIGRVAPLNVTVLILGESGTGKELVARAVYHYSRRADKPFLAINAAAIPETLLESELFGHEKGAFTGADRRRVGKFEQCCGGTLFLDEIGDISPLTQVKLLRVLQDQSFERVGGGTQRTDVRLIAATNRDLPRLVSEGRFREDLYYRLNVYAIRIPPLRERREDIPELAEHFARRFGRELGKEVQSVAPETIELLCAYAWPGNVRELQSVVKQAIVRASGSVLVPDFLPAELRARPGGPAPAPAPAPAPVVDGRDAWADLGALIRQRIAEGGTDLLAEFTSRLERQLFVEVLASTSYNVSQAARILGITRPTVRAKLAALGLLVERSVHLEGGATPSETPDAD